MHKNAPKSIKQQMRPKEILRFLSKLCFQNGVSGCWIWQGHKDKKGYGQFKWRGRAWWAHRLSYRTFVGYIPEGMTINHKRICRNPSCVNPNHLEPMTVQDNTRDMQEYYAILD